MEGDNLSLQWYSTKQGPKNYVDMFGEIDEHKPDQIHYCLTDDRLGHRKRLIIIVIAIALIIYFASSSSNTLFHLDDCVGLQIFHACQQLPRIVATNFRWFVGLVGIDRHRFTEIGGSQPSQNEKYDFG